MLKTRLVCSVFSELLKMAEQSIRNELQSVFGSGSSHKDAVEKYRKIFQKIIALQKPDISKCLKAFVECGKYAFKFNV